MPCSERSHRCCGQVRVEERRPETLRRVHEGVRQREDLGGAHDLRARRTRRRIVPGGERRRDPRNPSWTGVKAGETVQLWCQNMVSIQL